MAQVLVNFRMDDKSFEVSLSENNGDIVQDEAIKAFKKIRQKMMKNKKVWTMDEINKEIASARKKTKKH